MNKEIIFFNTGWMRDYEGLKGDTITGGGKHIQREGWGGKILNFKEFNGKYFGYVEAWGKVNINKIGAENVDDYVNNILVVWTARRPDTGGTYIIGWYKNAKTFRERQEPPINSEREFRNRTLEYVAEAEVKKSKLLTLDERTIRVPRGKGGMGQRNVWYGQNNPEFVNFVKQYIQEYETPGIVPPRGSSTPRQPDVEKRKKVEIAAIEETSKYYEELGYEVVSVESENYGWDLEAINDKIKLLIEVKGLSGKDLVAYLTPNEYNKLRTRKEIYRLCIVTNALKKPLLHVFSFSTDSGNWEDLNGLILSFNEIVRAQVSIEL